MERMGHGMDVLTQKLREKGLKVTPQRLSIYGMLMNTKEHPSAETIYEQIKIRMPSISFNTVYKTLGSLEESGLIKKLVVEENHYRFDADTSPHAHILCVQCNKLEDVPGEYGEKAKAMREEFSQKYGRKLFGEELYFFGHCLACAKLQQ